MRLASQGISVSIAAALLGVGLSSARASTMTPQLKSSQSAVHKFGQPHVSKKFTVAPGLAGELVARGMGLPRPLQSSWVKPRPNAVAPCVYLSDNSTGTVTIYSGAAPFPQIGALNHGAGANYGWGVGDTGPHQDAPGARNEVYVGASNDTIDVYDACKGMAVLRTLTGNGGGNGGAPYGLAVGDDGSVVADEFPNNAIDVWGPLPGEPLEGTVPEANMNLPYFLYYDNADPGAPGTAYVLVSGVSAGGAEQIDDCTLAFGPPPVLNCRTAITIAGGFPGGVAGLEISATRQNRGHKPNVIVDNQYGVLSAYGCDFPPPPGAITCIDRADFMYSNGQNPLDYTAIDVAWFPHNNARNLGAANIYFCNANKTTFCGDFTSQSLPLPWGPGWMLNGNSAQLGPPSMPLGFKIWPPNPHS